jgi:hypothetical protein
MKNVLFALLQFVLFLLVFAAGSFLPPFKIVHVISITADGTRAFYWDGVVLMVVLFAVILLIEAARKRVHSAALWTAVAFVLAFGVAAKLSFLSFTR